MSGKVGGLAIQSFLILSNFSACPGAALKFGYQSSVKESESEKKLVQKNPGPVLEEISIWGRESTHVDLDLKNSIRSAKQDDNYGASNIVLPCPGS